MKKIMITTDFTESSRNALKYMCGMITSDEYSFLLLHIFAMPVTYATDGVAMGSLREAMDNIEEQIEEEVEWVNENYPAVKIEPKIIAGGGFAETLQAQVAKEQPEIVVMGAPEDYEDMWATSDELLAALTELKLPALLIPHNAVYTSIKNIGFACDYKKSCLPEHITFIHWLTGFTGSQLHVIHVKRAQSPDDELIQKNEAALRRVLEATNPLYYSLEDANVTETIAKFIKDYKLDFLIVVSHRHDLWYSIFHQGHTVQLARLNHLPILALHD